MSISNRGTVSPDFMWHVHLLDSRGTVHLLTLSDMSISWTATAPLFMCPSPGFQKLLFLTASISWMLYKSISWTFPSPGGTTFCVSIWFSKTCIFDRLHLLNCLLKSSNFEWFEFNQFQWCNTVIRIGLVCKSSNKIQIWTWIMGWWSCSKPFGCPGECWMLLSEQIYVFRVLVWNVIFRKLNPWHYCSRRVYLLKARFTSIGLLPNKMENQFDLFGSSNWCSTSRRC